MCIRGSHLPLFFFFFNDTATTEIYTLSLHDALPISPRSRRGTVSVSSCAPSGLYTLRSEEHTSELQSLAYLVCRLLLEKKNKVVYTGTHDNPTSRAWYEELPPYQRQNLWRYLKSPEGESGHVAWDLIRLAWSSSAALAIAPLQDLLNLGPEARMNVPGRAEGNWSWRCTEELLSAADFHSLRDLTRSSNRTRLRSPLTSEMAEATS